MNRTDLEVEKTINDEFTRLCVIKSKHKIKSIDLNTEIIVKLDRNRDSKKSESEEIFAECKIACLLQNNQIEIYLVNLNAKMSMIDNPLIFLKIDAAGHRTDVRTICFSSDSSAFVSASGDSMKVWNRMNLSPIRSFNCDYALSSIFLSDDNHVIIGTNVILNDIFILILTPVHNINVLFSL